MWQPHELGRDVACAVAQTSHIFLLTALNKQAAHKSTQSPLLKYFSEDHFLETTRILLTSGGNYASTILVNLSKK